MPSKLKRVVLYLGEEHHAILKAESRRTGIPIAEYVRRLIVPPEDVHNLKASWAVEEDRRHLVERAGGKRCEVCAPYCPPLKD